MQDQGTEQRAVFIPTDEEADTLAQRRLREAHDLLIEAHRLSRLAGWGNQIRADMRSTMALLAHVRRGFL